MAISKKAQAQIEKAVARYKAYIRYKAVGPQALTREELKELIRSGMLTKETVTQAPVHEAYLHVHSQVATTPAPRQVRDGALDFLERMIQRYSDKLGEQIKTDVLTAVEHNIMPFSDRREGQAIYEALKDKDIWKKNLRTLLKDKVQNWEYRYRTIINTELNRASNWGSMDAILHDNAHLDPSQITVFKQGNKPGHGACDHCAKFWYLEDGITPRVYKMSELIANGSNIGRKAKDWLPTIDSTHPNETHLLSELKPGFGFVGGGLEWISDAHDEYARQRGQKPRPHLVLVKGETLIKSVPAPTRLGQVSEDGRYESAHHMGRVVWRYSGPEAALDDGVIKNKTQGYLATHPEAHHELIRGFVSSVATHKNRHLVTSREPTMAHMPRARHIRALLNGQPSVRMLVKEHKGGLALAFQAIRHGERDEVPADHFPVDTWVYTKASGLRHLRREFIHKDDLR